MGTGGEVGHLSRTRRALPDRPGTLLDRFLALEPREQHHRMNRFPGMLEVVLNESHAGGVAEKVLFPLKQNLPNTLGTPKGEGSRIGSHSRRENFSFATSIGP